MLDSTGDVLDKPENSRIIHPMSRQEAAKQFKAAGFSTCDRTIVVHDENYAQLRSASGERLIAELYYGEVSEA